MIHKDITDSILNGYFNVRCSLGYGFLERVYEHVMLIELSHLGFNVQKQVPIKVYFKYIQVGEYYADIIVENKVIIELRAAES